MHKHFKNTISDAELAHWTFEGEKQCFIENLKNKDLCIRVLLDATNAVIGFTRFGKDENAENLGWLDLIFVKDIYHRKGYGKILFNDSVNSLKAQGFNKMHLWTPTLGKSHGFYLKLDGTVTGSKINNIGFNLTEYSWEFK